MKSNIPNSNNATCALNEAQLIWLALDLAGWVDIQTESQDTSNTSSEILSTVMHMNTRI